MFTKNTVDGRLLQLFLNDAFMISYFVVVIMDQFI